MQVNKYPPCRDVPAGRLKKQLNIKKKNRFNSITNNMEGPFHSPKNNELKDSAKKIYKER